MGGRREGGGGEGEEGLKRRRAWEERLCRDGKEGEFCISSTYLIFRCLCLL